MGGFHPSRGVGQAEEGEHGGAFFLTIRSRGVDGNMETAVGEGEMVGKGTVRAEGNFLAVDGDLRPGDGTTINDQFCVHMYGKSAVSPAGAGAKAGGDAAGAQLEEAAAKRLGDFEGADADPPDQIAAEIIEDAIGHARGNEATERVGEGERVSLPLEPGQGFGQRLSRFYLRLDEIEQLAEGVVEGDSDEFHLLIGGRVVPRRQGFPGEGQLMEGAVPAVVAQFRLEAGPRAVHREIPFRGNPEKYESGGSFPDPK